MLVIYWAGFVLCRIAQTEKRIRTRLWSQSRRYRWVGKRERMRVWKI